MKKIFGTALVSIMGFFLLPTVSYASVDYGCAIDVFQSNDGNGDGFLSPAEKWFGPGVFDVIDTNDDGLISLGEWLVAVENGVYSLGQCN